MKLKDAVKIYASLTAKLNERSPEYYEKLPRPVRGAYFFRSFDKSIRLRGFGSYFKHFSIFSHSYREKHLKFYEEAVLLFQSEKIRNLYKKSYEIYKKYLNQFNPSNTKAPWSEAVSKEFSQITDEYNSLDQKPEDRLIKYLELYEEEIIDWVNKNTDYSEDLYSELLNNIIQGKLDEYILAINNTENLIIFELSEQIFREIMKYIENSEFAKSKIIRIRELVEFMDHFLRENAFWFKDSRLFPNENLFPNDKFYTALGVIEESIPKKLLDIINRASHSTCCWRDTMNEDQINDESVSIYRDMKNYFSMKDNLS